MLKVKLQYFGHLMRRADSLEKTLMLGKTEDEMVRRHYRLDGHGFGWTMGVGSAREDGGVSGVSSSCGARGCRGPAPADPGSSKERRLGDLFKC